jgi:putative hydrolase of the HAD superfamily
VKRPKGLLIDYGGTLVEEAGFDLRAGTEWLLSQATNNRADITLDLVMARANRVLAEISERRDEFGVEAPWSSLTRLIHDYFGTQFRLPMAELEAGFWDASMTTRPIPGAREALVAFHAAGVVMAVVSNASFSADVIHHDIARYGLADHLAFVMVSADYVVRKPNPMLFDTAAARLGVSPSEIWFVGDRLDTDVAGAQAAGIPAVWLRPPNAIHSGVPEMTVSSWTELRKQFEEARLA